MLWTPAPSPSAGAVPTHHLVQDVLQEVAVLVLLCHPLSQLLQTSLRNKDMGGLGIRREWAWWGAVPAVIGKAQQRPAQAMVGLCEVCPQPLGRSHIAQFLLGVGRSPRPRSHPCHNPSAEGPPAPAQLRTRTFWKLSFSSCNSSWKASMVVFREQLVVSISWSLSVT